MILLPHGLQAKRTVDVPAEAMAWLAMGERILPHLGLTLACAKCLQAGLKQGAVLQGQNNPSDAQMAVTCGCRRLVYQVKADGGA